MPLNSTKALFLCYLLTVALSCGAALGELNATAAPPPCSGLGGTAECLIAHQQPELELTADPKHSYVRLASNLRDLAGCGRPKQRYKSCLPSSNSKRPCYVYDRTCR
ncbi:uncharacterized protein J3R85_019231 [Psidium guajava]|nr:uncharacterized protein J3R85_019231 [Psidium guajava]